MSTSPSTSVSTTVDARGQSCPGPLVSLAKALKDAESGDLFELLATDPGSRSDVPSWAEISGNELLESSESSRRVPLPGQEGVTTMAAETVATEPSPHLRRAARSHRSARSRAAGLGEAEEQDDDHRVGRRPRSHLAHHDPGDDRRGERHGVQRVLHVLGSVRDREARCAHHRRQLDAEDDERHEPRFGAEGEAVALPLRGCAARRCSRSSPTITRSTSPRR